MLDHLNERMRAFIPQQEMLFISTADSLGHCDASIRVGPKGFIHILDSHSIAYPEYRGNGVYASLGNIVENGHIGLLMIDFYESTIGLHIKMGGPKLSIKLLAFTTHWQSGGFKSQLLKPIYSALNTFRA